MKRQNSLFYRRKATCITLKGNKSEKQTPASSEGNTGRQRPNGI